jgi:hypothetical protein
MGDYCNCDVLVAPKSNLKDGVYLRECLTSFFGKLTRDFRRFLPQISIILLFLAGAVSFTYYYYGMK